jgi:hypothetical protein
MGDMMGVVDIVGSTIGTEEGILVMMAIGIAMGHTGRGLVVGRRTGKDGAKLRDAGNNVRSRGWGWILLLGNSHVDRGCRGRQRSDRGRKSRLGLAPWPGESRLAGSPAVAIVAVRAAALTCGFEQNISVSRVIK